jgi:hypothetical protein
LWILTRKKWFRRSQPDSGPLGGPEAAVILQDLRQGDLHSLSTLLEGARQGRWGRRDVYCNLLSEAAPDSLLDAWCEADEYEPLAFLVRGRARIARAWQARGNAPAAFLGEDAWQEVTMRMMAAERDLLRAAELDPADPTPWSYLITVGTTLGYDRPAIDHFFAQAVHRDPEHFGAHQRMLQHVCEKWHGAPFEALHFARRVEAASSAGSLLPILIVDAYIEHWLFLRDFMHMAKEAKACLRDPAAQTECQRAYDRSLAGPGRHTSEYAVIARNIAATWFYLIGDRERLRREVGVIRRAFTPDPWAYLEEPAAAYARAVQYAGSP